MANRFLSNISINDAYTFPASDGSFGQAIVTDGAGNLSFGDVASGGSSAASVIFKDNFTGDGVETEFSMARGVTSEDQTQIYIDGAYQEKGTYTVSGNLITFSTAPASGHSIEVMTISGINTGPTTLYQDNFTGNGATTDFTLANSVDNEIKTMVFLNGVYQFKGTYSTSGTTLSFDTAPGNGTLIEVITIASAASPSEAQRVLFYGKASGAISKGDAVMFAGAEGDHFLFAKATQAAIAANHEYFIGLADQNFSDNEFGYVVEFGNITNIDTTVYTSTAGTTLWFDSEGATAGAITETEPTPPNVKIQVAAVIRLHPSVGSLFVRPTWYHELGELHDVNITSAADKDLLVWDAANGYWENSKTVDTLTATTLSATTLTGTLSTAAQPNITSVGTLTGLNVNGGTNNILASFTSTDTAARIEFADDTTSGQVSVGAQGSDFIAFTNSIERLRIDSDGNLLLQTAEKYIRLKSSGTPNGYVRMGDIYTTNGIELFGDNAATIASDLYSITVSDINNAITFNANSVEAGRFDSSGHLGLGTTNPDTILHLAEVAPIITFEDTTDNSIADILHNNSAMLFRVDRTNIGADSRFIWTADDVEKMRLDSTGLGIGTNNPSYQVHIQDSASATLAITAGTADNQYAQIILGDSAGLAQGRIRYENFTDSLNFVVNGGSKMLIDSSGRVGIGTSSPDAIITIDGGTANYTPSASGTGLFHIDAGLTSQYTFYIGLDDDGVSIGHNGSSRSLRFDTNETERMTIAATGDVGIGESSPIRPLHVNGGTDNIIALFESTDLTASIEIKDNTGSSTIYSFGGVMRIDASTGTQTLRLNDNATLEITEDNIVDGVTLRLNNTHNGSDWAAGSKIGVIDFYSQDTSGVLPGVLGAIELVQESASSTYPSQTDFVFKPSDAGLPTEVMRIAGDGAVGIGTSSPALTPLHIHNASGAAYLHITNGTVGDTATDGTSIIQDTDGDFLIRNRENANTLFYTNNLERARITGDGNVGIGKTPTAILDVNGDALINSLTVGRGAGNSTSNTVLGLSAFTSNVSGVNNTAIGNAALEDNTGNNNTAVGRVALSNNTSGGSNTAVGQAALITNTTGGANVAVGADAMFYNSTGIQNTAIGKSALQSNTTANNNTAVGYLAGFSNTTGASNLTIGYRAGFPITTGLNNVAIGKDALYAGTYPLQTGSNNIGIGTEPSCSSTSVSNELIICTRQIVGKGSNTGFIGANNGSIYQENNSSSWATTSDQRLKKNIVDNNEGLDKIKDIRVRNFEYRKPEEITELSPSDAINKEGVQLGVIAQELQQILPECVKQESTGVYSLDTDNLTWYMINAIKELKAEIDILKSK